jgi:hypothetical protein
MVLSRYFPEDMEENHKAKIVYVVGVSAKIRTLPFQNMSEFFLLNQLALYVIVSSQILYCLVVPVEIAFLLYILVSDPKLK